MADQHQKVMCRGRRGEQESNDSSSFRHEVMPHRVISISPRTSSKQSTSGPIPIMDQQQLYQCKTTSYKERIHFPQHLRVLVESTTKVTIVADNARAPPLSMESPLFRKERGLPPLALPITCRDASSWVLNSDGSLRRITKSRWDSMPQPKRISEDVSAISSVTRIRQDGPIMRDDELDYRVPPQPSEGPIALPISRTDTSANEDNNDKSPGLNIPKRRESFEVGKGLARKDGVSLLSQVLDAFDLSDEEDDAGESWMRGDTPLIASPGRFKALPITFGKQVQLANDVRSTLSPESPSKQKSAESLSIPVRRESIDSVDLFVEDLGDFFSDNECTEHSSEYLREVMDIDEEEEEDDDDDDDDEDQSDSYYDNYYDDTEDGDDMYEEGHSFRETCKDDSTLLSETTATTFSTSSDKGNKIEAIIHNSSK